MVLICWPGGRPVKINNGLHQRRMSLGSAEQGVAEGDEGDEGDEESPSQEGQEGNETQTGHEGHQGNEEVSHALEMIASKCVV